MSAIHNTRRQFLQSSAAVAGSLACSGLVRRLAWAAPAKDDWIELFDGKTLAGWHKNPERIGHGTGGSWQVEAGGIIAGEQDPPGSGNGGILLTDRKFSDFELSIDMWPDWGVDSGLFLRSSDRGQCIQMMVDYHEAGNVGHLYGEGTGGWNTRTFDINGKYAAEKKLVGLTTANHKQLDEVGLLSSCTPAQWLQAWRLNDWNTARVIVRGKYPQITTWINGVQVCQFDGATSTVAQYKKDDVLKSLGTEGSIAVQVHGGQGWPTGSKCRWRNIRLRPLAS